MINIWKKIEQYSNYEVSNTGLVRRIGRDVPLKMADNQGYKVVKLCRKGHKPRNELVHRLVAVTFIGPQPSASHEVAHWDGNRSNNEVPNLRWATRQENAADKVRHGRVGKWNNQGENHPRARLSTVDVAMIRGDARPTQIIAEQYGISRGYVYRLKAGERWRQAA